MMMFDEAVDFINGGGENIFVFIPGDSESLYWRNLYLVECKLVSISSERAYVFSREYIDGRSIGSRAFTFDMCFVDEAEAVEWYIREVSENIDVIRERT